MEIDEIKIKELDLLFNKLLMSLEIKYTTSNFSILSNVPPQECREFIGRASLKIQILKELKKLDVRAINIHAFGGYGKTELAKQIAFELIDGFKSD